MSTIDILPADSNTLRRLKDIPLGFRVALRRLTGLRHGRLDMHLPSGQILRFDSHQPGPCGELIIRDWRFVRRVMAAGDIGFADAYTRDEVDTPDLTALLEVFSRNFEIAGRLAVGAWFTRAINALQHRFLRQNSRSGSKRNILAHYDLGNSFYDLWLDPTMTYSSALFDTPSSTLEQAQLAKYRRIARQVGAAPGKHILEIGSGWGGFADVAAREFGAQVTSITISDAQHAFATRRMQEAGIADKADIRLCDYRDVTGQYDGVVSIEMFEAVGESYWPGYFGKIRDVLKPGGKAALQVITIDDDLFHRYRKRADFIQHYIFPGGMLPSIKQLDIATSQAGLRMDEAFMFGQDYARTLADWLKAFDKAWPEISQQGFDESFRRLWRFYLCYCEAGFRSGRIDVGHFTLSGD